MIKVRNSLLPIARFLGVAVLLCGAAWLDSDYYAPRKGEVTQPKPLPDADSLLDRRDQLKIEVTPDLIRANRASLAALIQHYGLEPRSSVPCSVRETAGPDADPVETANRPLNEGEVAVLCLN